MDSLSLPIFEGIHVERVPDLSSRFNSRPSLSGIARACERIAHSALATHQSLFSNVQCYSSAVHSLLLQVRAFLLRRLVGFFLKRAFLVRSHFLPCVMDFLFASDIFWVLLKLDFRVFHTRKLSYFFSLLFFLGGVVAKRGVRISHVTLSQY